MERKITKEEFTQILKDKGIHQQDCIDKFWATRPTDVIDVERLKWAVDQIKSHPATKPCLERSH